MKSNTKDWIQYGTALTMVASGIVLAFLSFLLLSIIESGVLMYIAQALVFAGAVFGVNLYYKTKFGDFESKTVDNLKDSVKDYVDNILNTKDDINPLDYQKSQK